MKLPNLNTLLSKLADPSALALAGLAILPQLSGLPGSFLMDDLCLLKSAGFASGEWFSQIWLNRPLEGVFHYFPLSQTLLALEFKVFGFAPAPFKIVSMLLHAANTLLLFKLLRPRFPRGALWGSAFFALHPLQIQTVQWVIEQNTLLAFFFSALSLHAVTRKKNIAGFALFAAALLSKINAIFVLALILPRLWHPDPTPRQRIPFLAYAAAGLGFGFLALESEARLLVFGPKAPLQDPLASRLTFILNNAGHYVSKLLFPADPAFFYPQWPDPSLQSAAAGWLILGIGILGLLCLWERRGAALYLRCALLSAAFFIPVLGFFPMSYPLLAPVADHFCYWPLAGLAPAAARLASALSAKQPKISALILSAVLGIYLLLGFKSAARFSSAALLWDDTLQKNPASAMAHHELGLQNAMEGKNENAAIRFKAALALEPDMDLAYVNLGNIALKAGNPDLAAALYLEALKKNPNRWQAERNLKKALAFKKSVTSSDSAD